MKKVLFIGNRLNVLLPLLDYTDLSIIKLYVHQDSLLHEQLASVPLPPNVPRDVFSFKDKQRLFEEIEAAEFDILISNGCPFILPVSKMKKPHQLFINIHPTLLPDLKGKTPLNGVFMTHRRAIGATMHYIDDGIDTGKIIAQAKVSLTPDLDQGLVYRISFGLESEAFTKGMKLLLEHDFDYAGKSQTGKGSYFNRTPEMQQIDSQQDATDHIIDTIKSFGVKAQGSLLKTTQANYQVFAAEKIQNSYLLKQYSDAEPGTLVLAYDDKLLVRSSDGLIKLTDFEIIEAGET